jgi:hypothetical protein
MSARTVGFANRDCFKLNGKIGPRLGGRIVVATIRASVKSKCHIRISLASRLQVRQTPLQLFAEGLLTLMRIVGEFLFFGSRRRKK